MLVTIQKTVEEQHELELPAYFEYGSDMVKVTGNESCIVASISSNAESISVRRYSPKLVGLYISGTPITADTFYKRFDEVLEQIENLKQPA